jgi:predicted lipoprotein with Yx(FWY)xxD motif
MLLLESVAAQTPSFTFHGATWFDFFGTSVHGAGDVNRDGFPDVIVGAPSDSRARGFVQVLSGKDGIVLHTFSGDAINDQFGAAVGGAGDVDKDGYADILVGAPLDDNKGAQSGMVRVFSGRTGNILFTRDGDAAGDYLGQSVSGAGDVNKDGHADFIAGAAININGSQKGYARVYSGKDGSTLYTFRGDSAGDRFGTAVSGAGDLNKDGYDDILVGAPSDDNKGSQSGMARAFSGKDGKILFSVDGGAAGDEFGVSLDGAGDVDNDTFPDLIVGAWKADNQAMNNAGSARVVSGKDGSTLYTFLGDSASDLFGVSVAGGSDLDGDGRPDLLVGAHFDDDNGAQSGSARAFSGKDGKTLFTIFGDKASDQFGFSVSDVGDLNGDGFAEIIVGAPEADSSPINNDGLARIHSGSKAVLSADVFAIQFTNPGRQNLTMDAGKTNASRLYWIFGSITGIKPGVTLGSVHIPLNPDIYTDLALALPSPFFVGFRGTLDANGRATAAFVVPKNLPPSAGGTLFHAGLVYDAANNFYLASNAVPLRLY